MAAAWASDLLAAVFHQARDVQASYTAYRRYWRKGGDDYLEAAFRDALPVVRDVCRSRDPEFVSVAAWAVFRALRRRGFKRGTPGHYWIYLRHIALGAIVHETEYRRPKVIYADRVRGVQPDYEVGFTRVVSYDDIDRKMIVEKIPVLVAQRVVDRLRFEGEDREACLFILRCLIEGYTPPPRGLKQSFDLTATRLKFLLDYVTTRVRVALRAIRAELRAAGGSSIGWLGNITVHTWLYGEDDDVAWDGFAS